METISQMATSATKFAFGDSANQEPISGSQGDVTKGEPYDAGNLDPKEQERLSQSLDEDSNSQKPGNIATATNPIDDSGFTHPKHDLSAPGRSTSREDIPGGITTSTNRTTDSGFTSPGQDMGGHTRGASAFDNNSSSSSSNKNQSTSHQNLNTTGDNLASRELNRADDASAANNDSKSKPSKKPSAGADDDDERPVDVSGPGPRDISTAARENGGDAGSHGSSGPASHATAAPGSNLPADGQGQDKGTGEMYVRSSGLQADGGDFDATRPGAGREADRLMEEKGVSASSAGGGKDKFAPGHGGEGKEKHGIVEKIKEKLHRH